MNWLRPVSNVGGHRDSSPHALAREAVNSAGAATRSDLLVKAGPIQRGLSRMDIGPALELQFDHTPDAERHEAGAGNQRNGYLLPGFGDRF